jgi:hypothetical protein
VGLIPHSKRSRINLDDGALDESIGSDQLVVRSIVHLFHVTIILGIALENNKKKIRTTLIMRVLRVTCSEPHAKLPESRRRARYLRLPPRTRTVCMRLAPSLVFAGWRPSSNFRFLR